MIGLGGGTIIKFSLLNGRLFYVFHTHSFSVEGFKDRTFQLPIIDMNSSFELAEWLVHSLARAQYKLDYVSWGLMSFAIVGSINQLRS